MNETLVNIPVSEIYPHRDNPRKEIGDITELAESIRQQGILQNLTVIRGHYMTNEEHSALSAQYAACPDEELRVRINSKWMEDKYTVIIGHRRLAAAKLAELSTVPCVITEMTRQEQLSTMLCENMHRNDLTIAEQVNGFKQLSMEGLDVAEISKMSGFSDTTVRGRLKLAKLNPMLFKDACRRGGTLEEYAKVAEIELEADRDKVLDKIGTADFKNALKQALDEQKFRKKKTEWIEFLDKFAERIDDYVYSDYCYVMDISSYNINTRKIEDFSIDETKKYIYSVRPSGTIYILHEKEVVEEISNEEQERRLRKQKSEAFEEKLEDIRLRHFELRRDFVKDFAIQKKGEKETRETLRRCLCETITWKNIKKKSYYERFFDVDIFCSIIGIEKEAEFENNAEAFKTACENALNNHDNEKIMLALIYSMLDSTDRAYWEKAWTSGCYGFEYYNDSYLNMLYNILEKLGYEISSEEHQFMYGEYNLSFEEENDG